MEAATAPDLGNLCLQALVRLFVMIARIGLARNRLWHEKNRKNQSSKSLKAWNGVLNQFIKLSLLNR